jgi:cytochrome P450
LISGANVHLLPGPLIHISALGQPLIIINDVKIATDLLDKKSALYSDRPTLHMAGELAGWDHTLVLQHYGERMKDYRRYIHRLLGTRAGVERFHPLIEHEGRVMMKRILADPDDFLEPIRKAAGAIIMKMTYGYDVREKEDPIVDLVNQATTEFGEVTDASNVWLVDLIPARASSSTTCLNSADIFYSISETRSRVASRCIVSEDCKGVRQDFAGHDQRAHGLRQVAHGARLCLRPFPLVLTLSQATGEAESCLVSDLIESSGRTAEEEENIKWAAASLYSGGADTTVSTMHTFFLCMTLFPEAQRKAQAEIDAVIGHDRLPTLDDRARLPYLEALVSEMLRWGPVGTICIPHRLIEDDVYNGHFIPRGSIVFANMWAMLHDPAVYADPLAFEPERFIPRAGKPAEQDPRACCFGFGRRVCPGMNLAEASVWLETALALATLNITKARDAAGVEITPSGRYLDGTISYVHHVCLHSVPH